MAIILTAYPNSLEVTQGEHIVEGSVNAIDVEFHFPAGENTWTGMALVAVFQTNLGLWETALDFVSCSCKIPWEAIAEGSAGSSLRIGLYGVQEDDPSIVVRNTVWAAMPFRIMPKPKEEDEPEPSPDAPDAQPTQDPTPSLTQALLSEVSKVLQRFPAILGAEQNTSSLYEQTKTLRDLTANDTTAAKNSATAAQTSAQSAQASAQAAQKAADQIAAFESFSYEIGHGLKVEDNRLMVDSVSDFDGDNTLPATASLVQTTVGNIEILLSTI